MMTVFLFSLIGIPLTVGFNGKFLIFFGALAVPGDHAQLFATLAFLGVVNAAIGGWYYLRIVAVMYLRTSVKPLQVVRNLPALAALGVCVLLTIGLSIPPGTNWLLQAARSAAGTKTTPPGPLAANTVIELSETKHVGDGQ